MNKTTTSLQNLGVKALDRRTLLRGALGTMLLPTAGSLLLAGCGGGDDDNSVAATPTLSSVVNFRDVAGQSDSTVYKTSSGAKLQRGVLYRSNALSASTADLATLDTLGIAWIYDLRTTSEIASAADTVPSNASYLNVNILGTTSTSSAVASITSAAAAVTYMEAMNQAFVTDSSMRAKFAELFTDISNGASAQLFHCTAGKDRTGWTAAVLLTMVGVSATDVMTDYLLSNTYLATWITAQYNAIASAYGTAYAEILLPVYQVQESYLQAGLDQVTTTYGTMSSYLTDGLGLSTATQAKLKALLLA